MRVAIPHQLDNDTVRERLRNGVGKAGDNIPGGATVRSSWPTEERMVLNISAMGQSIEGHVDLEPGQLIFTVALTLALSFIERMISGAIATQGAKMLEAPDAKGKSY